jgi:NAD(P)H-hydrate repair Nnr-like enzyme with NAD(P)H-hydrate epimerase domain/8-oxo-dGTP pyrophosphatase MutT (NUDIX family)
MDVWARIRERLAQQPPASTATPSGGRLGATLALLAEADDDDLEIVYTLRREDLAHHPGQISFPGGRAEPGEEVEDAALREACEEIGLDPDTASVLGRLPPFYIPPSRFWLQTVIARWNHPHPLVAAEAEVAEVLQVRYSTLADPDSWRVVPSATAGEKWWAWQLDSRHLLWGATAVATVELLEVIDPEWNRGVRLADFGPEREVTPWIRETRVAPRPGPPRLAGVPEVTADAAAYAERSPRPLSEDALARAGAAVADAAADLAGGDGSVLVLAGNGTVGEVGRAAAERLRRQDREVAVVTPAEFTGELPDADVVVDALVGAGLSGPLAGGEQAITQALRLHVVPIVSVDVPSGLDPDRGLVGDTVTADVTVALAAPRPGLFRPGLSPFVGDLYVADLSDGTLVRLVPPDEE